MGKEQSQRRQPDADDRLGLAFLETFKTPSGQMVLQHLRSAFINSIMPADATDAQLRYREGQRSVIGIIDTRIKEGTNYARKQSA